MSAPSARWSQVRADYLLRYALNALNNLEPDAYCVLKNKIEDYLLARSELASNRPTARPHAPAGGEGDVDVVRVER